MPAITINDLNNAKRDVDHIAEVATSTAPTATDRLGHVKKTLQGAVDTIAAITVRDAWAPDTAYSVKDVAQVGATWYIAVVAHTSGAAFPDDVLNWRVYQGVIAEDLASPSGSAQMGFVQAGAGAEPRTVEGKLRDVVSVKDYFVAAEMGASAMLQRAIDAVYAAGGGTVIVPALPFAFTSSVSMKSGVTVKCEDGAVLDFNGQASGSSVIFQGAVGAEYAFAAARTRGDTTLPLSGSPDLTAGDIVHLVSYTSVFAAGLYNLGYHATDNCYYAEWNIIAEDMGGGVYRLAYPLEFPDWTTSAKAKKVTPCENAHWVGGTIERTASGGALDSIFASEWAYRCSVRGATANRGTKAGNTINWLSSWQCEGRDVKNNNDPKRLFVYDADHSRLNRFRTVGSQDCGFIGLRESFGGQSVDFTYSSSLAPYANVRSYCRDGFFHRCFEGLTSHQGCYQEQWVDNNITECYDDGILSRGYMPTIKDNVITSVESVTDNLVYSAGSFIVGRRYQIWSAGTTDFTLIGAADNNAGTKFVATGPGVGTGRAVAEDVHGILLANGGARRADVTGNRINGFYGAVSIDVTTVGAGNEWGNVLANIHDNEISNCFTGLITQALGKPGSVRFITYQNNHHSLMGRHVAVLGEYSAGCTIKGNVLDGAFRYNGDGTYVAFVDAKNNCPSLVIKGNVWNRTKGSNAGKVKYMSFVRAITDTAAFPEADWAAQTHVDDNYATFATDASFVYASIQLGSAYYQEATLIPSAFSSTIASGVAKAIPTPHRSFYVNLDTEGAAATDDLDRLDPYTNCFFAEGDVVYLRTTANSRDVVIRDIATTGASANGFQTPGNASITLGTSNDIVTCIHNGTHWCVSAQSLNG